MQIRNASNSYTDISTALRPEDNFFNSKITRYGQDVTNRVPASTNTLGFDAGVFTLNNPNNSLLGNDQTSTILRLTSTQETYSLYMVGLAVEVYEPELSPLLLTTNLGAQNELIIDQTVRATFQVKNFGNDDMKNLSISYVVPSSVNYVPNASLLPAGVTVNYVAGTRTLNFGFADNIVEVGDAVLSVGFDLKASSDCSLAGTQFNLQLNANYRGVKNTTQKTTLSSSALSGACPVGNLQPSRITLVASGACKPTAVNDSASTQVDSPLNIDVVINDNFGGDGPASQAIVVASNPSNGTAVVDTNGTPNDPTDDTILYTPALGYVGSDSFTYTIKDANGDTSTATVDVTVSNVIVTPPGQRNCDCAPFYQNSNFVNPVKISGTNLQPGAVYRFSNVFTDSPSPIDALVKIVKFNNGASLLNIDVAGQGVPANFQPQIKSSTNGDQSVEFEITFVTGGGNYGNEVVISFFGTPFDIDGDSQRTREYAELSLPDAYYQSADTRISIQRKIGSVRGTAINPTTAPGGDISSDARYTFSNYWEGKSKLNYTIGKENGNSDRYYSLALKNANYANPQSTIVTAPVICGNVSDEGGDPLRGVKVNITGTDGSSATLSTDINGNYRYQTSIPSALVDVTYTITETDLENYVSISDADGGPDFNKITRVVNLMSTCQNNFVDDGRPLAQDDAAQASPLRPIQPVNIRVLENDIFGPDGPSTGTITIVSQPAVGSAVVNNSGTPNDPTDDFITYNPPLLNLVPVQLTYQICDSDGDCDTAVVRIGILDDSPRAQDDQYTVSEDSQNNPLTVLVNDDFGNDGPGSLSVVSGPSNGTLTPNNNGTPGDLSDDFFTYTPNADYFGNDLFTYQICDADSPISDRECSTATVRILVAADPTLSVQPVQVVEGQPLQFVFTISDVSTEDVVIQVNTSDVSATAGLDYTAAVNQIITIPAGQLTANYVVNSLEDIIYENSEVFNIQGSVQTNNTRNLTVSTTGTITDNDGAAPTITIADVTVAEGVDAVFVVTLDKPSYEDIVVDITFADGTATNPEDYTDGTPLQVTIPAGQTTSGPITFPTVDDALFEVNENFTVTGTVASGTTAAPNATGTGTITDNDGAAPTITIADVTVAEGADAVFVVTLDKPSYEDIVVDITFADGTATNPEDYTDGTPLQVTIPAGQTTSGPITFPTVDDALFEVNENFTVTGTVASGTTAAPSATGTGTITDNDGAAPTITIADVTVAEGVDAVFVVTLDKPSYEDIVVDITFADGTATNPEDYTDGTPLQVTIPAGQTTSGPITFPTVDDALFEVAENFTVTGTVASGTTAAPNATGTGTITDNDGAAPTITIADVTVAEGVDAVFVVTLDKPSYEDIVVDITFADGTATNPEDYTDGTPLQVTIPAGQTTSGPITFPTVDDALFEVDENFTVTGTVASGTTAAPGATGTGTITDNDGAAPTITIADVTVAEGVDAVFVVTLDKPSYEDIVVDITFADGTATNPEDYTDGTPLQVTIPAGQTTSGPITFPTVDDALFEVAENFTVTGTVASGTTAAPNATGTGTITDNDGAAPTITIADVTVAEGVDAVFVVTLDKPSYEDIVVDITFADGTATNPEDYTDGTPLQVTIPAGQTTSGPITFPTVDDALFEVAENFTVTGTVASGTTAAPNATGTGTITDNDGAAPTITIADVTVAEGADAVFVVTLDKPSYEDIVVDITFADGTATNPEDYTDGTPLQVTIPAGQTTSGPITFPTVDDALFEVNENFTVTGTVASGTTAAPSATGTGTITDNDGAAPTITIADVTVAEGVDAVFVVTLDKPSYEDIVVDITFADGTATNPEDYTDGTPLQVTIPAGQTTSGPITFPTVDDALFEVNENFTVTGTVASGTTAAPSATGTGTITDNDGAAPTITIADVTVAEGVDAVFVVTLDKPSYEDIVVDITFADGTATNPEDYTDGTPLQVTIPAGQTTSGPITFPTVDDALFEVAENFTVTGTVASGTTAAPNATGTGTITDNDGAAPTITIADVTVAEGVDAVFVVTLDKPSYEDIVVDITFADGTATNPEDYTDGTPLQVTIPAGQTTSGPITFPTVDDALFEVAENFTVTGTVASGTTAAPGATGTGTITDNDGAAPTITIADVTVAEGVDAVFVVTLDKPSYEDIVVDITFADGTATNPEDYTDGTPLQVTIPAGQTTSGPITFPTVDDALFEVAENFTVTGTVASGTTAAPNATGTGTITDNDGAAPTITIADVTVAEGADAVFVVTLDKPSYEDIVVDITFADGTATNPEDYTDGTPLQVTIPAGQTTSGPITFPTVDDALFEVAENFTVTGTVASGTTAAPSATGTGTITDNDGAAPTITIADVTVAEGVDAVFVVTLDKPSYEDIVVDITFADGTATNPEDYTDGTPLQVTIPAGQTTSGPITFPTVDDALFEVAENFTVTGTVASGTTAAPSATGTGTITDNDGAAPTITIADVTVAEGADAVFVVTLDKPSYEDIVVDITFADGTATNPEDYTDGTPLQVTIPAGQTTSGPITFPTVDDALFEVAENFTVTGTVASGTTTAPGATGTGTITDNDGAAPTITIADVTVAEGVDAVFVVTLDKPSYEDIVVDITFADGTATNPEDYTDGTPLQVTIPAGQTTSGPITFPTVDDALFEVNENFTVTGTVASGTTAAPSATGTGTITDNDGAAPTITIADVTVAEGADAVFVVTLDKPSYEDIVVDITFADGTATNPEDYTDGTPLQVTIPAGQTTSGPITFPTVDDALFEVNENFTVTGTVASGTTAAPNATGTGTITDNDGAAPTITIADVTVAEGADAVFVVTLDKPSYEDIVVDITFADGTATNPEDYTDGTPLQVTIPAGQTTSGPITFPTVDDALFEVNENFTVTGTVASGTTAAPNATGTGTITDNDGAAPTITIADVTVAEGVDAVFVVTLDKPSYEDIVVDITFADGTATNPEDYTDGTPLQVTIPAGQTTSGPITFPTVDDALFEVDENFTVTGTVASGTTAAPNATGTGTITDNDGAAPTITIADVTVAEGVDAVFVVTLDKPSYEDIVVDITFADGTATNPEDYTDGTPLQVTIPAGQTTSGPITFPTVDDALFEVNENFTVTGTVASGTTAAPSATGTGTITDNDGAAPTITIADVTVAEGVDAVFVVTLDKPSYEDIVVDITFADGTATNPEDYTDGTPLQVIIPAGQTTSGPITFPTVDDALFEVDENFTVTGTVASGTTAAPSATGTGTITDNDGAAPTITIADVTVAEGVDAVFVVTLDKPSYEDIVVDITFADGTATNPEDYTDGTPLQVTIPAGQTTSGPITFPTVDDALFEVAENFTVTGTVASGTTAAPSATGTGTITDNDGAAPTITIADVTVAEGVDAVFVVTLDKPSYEDIVVDITFADGTATNPEDYTDGTPLQVTIPAGQTTSGPITFPTVDDALFEINENFTVTGTVASGTTAAPNATGTGTITDNDGAAPTITIADVTVAEGADAVFVVTLDKPSYEDIVVDITFADGTATNPEDYTDGTPLQVTIPAGQTTSGPITFPTVDDALFEVNENFTVTGTVASGTTAAPNATGTGTITDNDGAAPTITIADVTVAEGADAVFVVTLDKPSYEDIVVDITFADGTATNPEDYTDGTPLQVTIPAGQTTSGPITFPTVDDALFEVNENFTVTGTVASGTTAAPSATGTGTITDNDGAAPTITIADVTVAEGVDAVFVVTLDKPSYEDIVVDITFADGTATNPEDYTDGTPLQVTIPAGQTTSGPITFPTVDDALFEVNENFTVTGTVASGTTAAPSATGTGTITDNDGAAPTITIADVTVAEGVDAVFVVTLDKPSYEDIVVDITFADGTATNPEDYTDGTPLQVTIPAGQTTSGPITFPTVDDALFEVDENFTVTGTVASGTTAAPSATGTGTITDNDGAAPTITIADVTVAEGADAVFVVTLDKPSYEDIVVDITFADGTATNPEDYTDGIPLQVTIPAGQTTSGPITFPTVDDALFEVDENFTVTGTVASGTTAAPSATGTGTITDNDGAAPTITIADVTVAEGADAVFVVTLDNQVMRIL
ncbi:Calx-beta domain-containing protein [Leeuwenhoekiella sp. MAR_2009_132]|uniref:Calx-beta domain-containing protein n=1 Tax=Leeuwenhoekiella sp. MAR_2009_132 TaxID=1392489 RepID=UPI00048E9E60|nr:Calx-beta domain-containing protein [Leeuwenhoekiella sp. MAR_2009_132]